MLTAIDVTADFQPLDGVALGILEGSLKAFAR